MESDKTNVYVNMRTEMDSDNSKPSMDVGRGREGRRGEIGTWGYELQTRV